MENKIARIENSLILNSQFRLSLREQKIVLYLIAQIDPAKMDKFETQSITFREFKEILQSDDSKWGGLYKEIQSFIDQISIKRIKLLSDVEVSGKKLSGYMIWFQEVRPQINKNGEKCIEFKFGEQLKHFILELKEYARIDRLEVASFKSAYSIRLFLIFRAHREKMRKWEHEVSYLKYSLNDLRDLIDATKKEKGRFVKYLYEKWSHFDAKVLQIAKAEVNENTSLEIEYEPIKSGRKITGVQFAIRDSKKKERLKLEKQNESKREKQAAITPPPSSFTWSQVKAYDKLVMFGVDSSIAVKQIIPTIEGAEFEGFEDYFIEEVISHIQRKSKAEKSKLGGVLVSWWIKKKAFAVGNDTWSKILETILVKKKELEKKEPESFYNRKLAATMPEKDFKKWYREKQEKKKEVESISDQITKASLKMGF